MKKFIIIFAIVLTALLIVFAGTGYYLYQKPSFQLLLTMADIIKPNNYTNNEVMIKVNNKEIPMMIYKPTVKPLKNKYYFFLHGFTPESYKHPTILKMAIAIAHASGRTILIPHIQGSIKAEREIKDVIREVGDIYMTLRDTYPGDYNAFGACIAGTGLLMALNHIPVEKYPQKLFLFGPFFTGKDLINFYNQAGVKYDYMVNMANALYNPKFTSAEKELISKAIIASKPGTTDESEMKKILGGALFTKIKNEKFFHQEVAELNEKAIFSPGKKTPTSNFFIIHAYADNIIPFSAGKALNNFLLDCGAKSRFVGTHIFAHTKSKLSPLAFLKELNELIGFLDDLLSESR